jgi:hypothetical protein
MAERCPVAQDDCKYAGTRYCQLTVHHRFWPRRDYSTEAAHDFRELPENKELLSRCDHDELHRTEEPPRKPPEWYMEARIRLAEQAIEATLNTDGAA